VRHSFYRPQRRKRTPIPGTDFVVQDGRVDVAEAALLTGPEGILRVFALVAAHGYRLTQNAEDRLADALPVLDVHIPEGPFLWNGLREILLGPHAAHALRTMHALGILELLIPEFHGIDALVIRDSYHRYTVDEHTFLVIDSVHALRQPHEAWERRFSTLLAEVERLDLFFLAVLMHDTGKARRSGDHTVQSVDLADSLLARLELDPEERDQVRRLIRNHLEMSLTLRRDIFATETIRAFAEKAASHTHLKMLTLMTYADIKAVNPDALTPWKADSLWQLYIATSNFMDRSVDQERYRADVDPTLLKRILTLAPPERATELRSFLEGFPQRYLQTRMPEQIRDHFQMALQLQHSAAQLSLRPLRQLFELTVISKDRPLLFADMAGALSSWGMNIVKAEAFSDDAGVVVDTFHFSDPFRTLELNPTEVERFRNSILDVVSLKTPIEVLLRRQSVRPQVMVKVATRLDFDDSASTHSTLLQVVAQDGPGLLRQIATTLAAHDCNIEVALIDTEGEIAIDVFYLTIRGAKLDATTQERLQAALLLAIEELRPAHTT